MTGSESMEVQIARVQEQLDSVEECVNDIRDQLRETGRLNAATYVTREEFKPVKSIVYGMVSFMLLSILAAITVTAIRQ